MLSQKIGCTEQTEDVAILVSEVRLQVWRPGRQCTDDSGFVVHEAYICSPELLQKHWGHHNKLFVLFDALKPLHTCNMYWSSSET